MINPALRVNLSNNFYSPPEYRAAASSQQFSECPVRQKFFLPRPVRYEALKRILAARRLLVHRHKKPNAPGRPLPTFFHE